MSFLSSECSLKVSFTIYSIYRYYFQEAAYIKIHAEIPDVLANHSKPCNTSIYPTWEKFLEAFLAKGNDLHEMQCYIHNIENNMIFHIFSTCGI